MKASISFILIGAAAVSPAAILQFSASLDGGQETTPTGSPVTATINMLVDDATGLITSGTGTLSQTFSSSLSGFHIHQAPAGTNGSVKVNIGTGAFSGTAISFSGQTIASDVLAAMIAGDTYFNIHTTNFPGGEIRGQIAAVPEPGTMAALALGGAVLARRRRKA